METWSDGVRESFSEEITPASGERLLEKIDEYAQRGVEHVALDISSPGGDVSTATTLYKTLGASSVELTTRNVGSVSSMANLLFLAGEKRLALPGTSFFLHPVELNWVVKLDQPALERICRRFELKGHSDRAVELGARIAEMKREDREVREIIAQETALSYEEASSLIQQARPFDAFRAQQLGFVHEVPGITTEDPRSAIS
jgi:ATP-dependent protease ClpP protease subunit